MRERVARPSEWTISTRSFWCFLIGCTSFVPLTLIGVIYLGEILFSVLACWVVLTRLTSRKFWSPEAGRFCALMMIGLASYIVTDLYRNSSSTDYLRGWSRTVFMAANFIAIYYLFRKHISSFVWFLLGYQLVSLGFALFNPVFFSSFLAEWKYGLSGPLTFIALCLLAMLGRVGMRLTPYVLALLGAVHVILDYRSLGGICLLAAAMLLSATIKRGGKRRIDRRLLTLALVGCGVAVASLYLAGQDQFADRRHLSNSWRIGTTVATLKGIARAPLIGNGSWATDEQMESWRNEAMGVNRIFATTQAFTAHSQIFEAWYEGGLLAGLFFFYYAFQLAAALKILLARPMDKLSGIFLFVTLFAGWNLICSPLNGFARIDIAVAAFVFCYLQTERRNLRMARLSVPYGRPDAGLLAYAPELAAYPRQR